MNLIHQMDTHILPTPQSSSHAPARQPGNDGNGGNGGSGRNAQCLYRRIKAAFYSIMGNNFLKRCPCCASIKHH
jgi:hypothetical protein